MRPIHLVINGVTLLVLLVVSWLWWSSTRTPVTITSAPQTINIFSPAAAAPAKVVLITRPDTEPAFGPGTCPGPGKGKGKGRGKGKGKDTLAGEPVSGLDLEKQPKEQLLLGVAASEATPGVLAAWTNTRVLRSIDDGISFHRVLDNPGDVAHVAVDCHGRVIALRDRHLLGIRRGDKEQWQMLDDAKKFHPTSWKHGGYRQKPLVAAGGGWLAWIVTRDEHAALLGLSYDSGRHWRYRRFSNYSELRAHLSLTHRGTVHLRLTQFDCMAGDQQVHLGRADGPLRKTTLPDIENGAWIGHDGWVYTDAARCRDDANRLVLCTLHPRSNTWRPMSPPIPNQESLLSVAENGRRTMAVIGERLYGLRRGRARLLSSKVPGYATATAVDSQGRLLSLLEGHVVRWSPRRGWRVIAGPALGKD